MDISTALDTGPQGPCCKIQRILDGIPDDTPGKAELLEAMADEARSSLSLAWTLRALDRPVSYETMRRHRAGYCGRAS